MILVCGDDFCDVKYENCSNCPLDCGKCPLKPIQIGLITFGCAIVVFSFIGVGLVSLITRNSFYRDNTNLSLSVFQNKRATSSLGSKLDY